MMCSVGLVVALVAWYFACCDFTDVIWWFLCHGCGFGWVFWRALRFGDLVSCGLLQ